VGDSQTTSDAVQGEVETGDNQVENQKDSAAQSEPDTASNANAESTDTESAASVASPESQIEQLNEQLAQAKDQALRTAAEMQNLRRRAERDVESAHKFGQEKLINSLLPVLDNLDRAIDSAQKDAGDAELPEAVKSLLEGVELTRKSTLDALKRFSVDVLEPYGEPFDPQFHEAMTMVPSDTAEPNSVIDVLQKGYSLNGRLLRAAMVVVAKASDS
jgi:molecular chaperone GrpE